MALILPDKQTNFIVYGSTALRNAATVIWRPGDVAVISAGNDYSWWRYSGEPKEAAGTSVDTDWTRDFALDRDSFAEIQSGDRKFIWHPTTSRWTEGVGEISSLTAHGSYTDQNGNPDERGELWIGTSATERLAAGANMNTIREIKVSQLSNPSGTHTFIFGLLQANSIISIVSGDMEFVGFLSETPTVTTGTWTFKFAETGVLASAGTFTQGSTFVLTARVGHRGSNVLDGSEVIRGSIPHTAVDGNFRSDIYSDTATVQYSAGVNGFELVSPTEAASDTHTDGIRPAHMRVDTDTFNLNPTTHRVVGLDHINRFQHWGIGDGIGINDSHDIGVVGYNTIPFHLLHRYEEGNFDDSSNTPTGNGNFVALTGFAYTRVANNTAWSTSMHFSFADNDMDGNSISWGDLEVGDAIRIAIDQDNWIVVSLTSTLTDNTGYYRLDSGSYTILASSGTYQHGAQVFVRFSTENTPIVFNSDIIDGAITQTKLHADVRQLLNIVSNTPRVRVKARIGPTGAVTREFGSPTVSVSGNTFTITYPELTTLPIVHVTGDDTSATASVTGHVKSVSTTQTEIVTFNDGSAAAEGFYFTIIA